MDPTGTTKATTSGEAPCNRGLKLAASIMCADFSRLGEQVRCLEQGGIDLLHFDIMDGRFAPNFTMGPKVLEDLRKVTSLPFEVHLAIQEPDGYVERFLDVGAGLVYVHVEAVRWPHRTLRRIQERGGKAGVALEPATPVEYVEGLLGVADAVMLLAVDVGFAGQRFIPEALGKVRKARDMIDARHLPTSIEVGGDIGCETAPAVIQAGADVLNLGSSSIFAGDDIADSTRRFREFCAREYAGRRVHQD